MPLWGWCVPHIFEEYAMKTDKNQYVPRKKTEKGPKGPAKRPTPAFRNLSDDEFVERLLQSMPHLAVR